MRRLESGSILQSIRSSDLKKIKIILPPEEMQNSMGDKLKKAVYISASARKIIKEAEGSLTSQLF